MVGLGCVSRCILGEKVALAIAINFDSRGATSRRSAGFFGTPARRGSPAKAGNTEIFENLRNLSPLVGVYKLETNGLAETISFSNCEGPAMRYLSTAVCLMLSVMVTGAARADDDTFANNDDRAGRRGEMRQKMLEEFDDDGDGELSDDERATAREAMRARRGGKGKGGKAKGGKKGRRGSPGGRPDPGKLFDKYDANGDGQLSRAEFMKLAKEVRPPRPPREQGKRGGPGREGPPQGGRRRFESDRPLQNPSDRPGPPPRPEGRRRFDGDEGPRAGGHKGHRHGPPSPEKVFDRFDEDGDDQLSREEFMNLADHMREMRERMGHGGHGSRRGPRRGPPGDRPPPRPEFDYDGPEMPEMDDDSV